MVEERRLREGQTIPDRDAVIRHYEETARLQAEGKLPWHPPGKYARLLEAMARR